LERDQSDEEDCARRRGDGSTGERLHHHRSVYRRPEDLQYGVSVTRSGDQIILNMPSDITFNVDQDAVKPGFYPVLNSVALVLKKFRQTTVDVFGHTDSTGGDQHNFDLSQRRALAVANYLSGQGVDQRRFAVTGFGKTRPIASNATAAGREQNRRVEIQLSPLT
jgi:outer membrane protein OmpA-like peptidoglycan-associated protein